MSHGIILFDGVCNFCNRSVNFIMDHDPSGYFKFAASQSEAGQALLARYGISSSNLDTLILIEDNVVYTRSTAVLRIAKNLRGSYALLYDFIVVPEFIRDPLYDLFARFRYTMFGKKNKCRIPTNEEKARFL